MRVLHTGLPEAFLAAVVDRLSGVDPAVELIPLGEGSGEALLVGSSLSRDELREAVAAGVRWVQTPMAGLERILSDELVAIPMLLTSGAGTAAEPMAEFVFARILEHAKNLRRLANLQVARRWEPEPLLDLAGSTLTVVGLGATGRRVAEVGDTFRMRVVGVRRRPEAGKGPCHEIVGPASLVDMATATDYLVVVAALTPETRGLVGARVLAAMKEGALLVNVSRGELVDQAAVASAVASGRIRAALDVFEEEPLDSASDLWALPGLSVSPHVSALTLSLFESRADLVAANVRRFVGGRPLANVVDKHLGYPLAD